MSGVITHRAALWLLVMASSFSAVLAHATTEPAARARTPLYQEMVDVIRPASDAIFDVDREAPTSDAAWISMARAGAMLVESGRRLKKLEAEAGDRDRGTWGKLSKQMADAGRAATKAAESRSPGSMMRASERLMIVCETCHAQYRKPVFDP